MRDFSSMVELVRHRALEQPAQRLYTFLDDGETEQASLTYGELDRQARAIGGWLQSTVASGERVLLLYMTELDYIAAFFGCLYAGVVAVPVYPPDLIRLNRSLPRLQAIMADAGVSAVLSTSAVLGLAEPFIAQMPALQALRWLATDQTAAGQAEAWRPPKLDRHSLAFLQYTSGSTGTPKGVMVTHGNLLSNQAMIQHAFGHDDKTVVVGWLPLYHDMGLIGNVMQPLYLGIPCILMSPLAFLQKPVRWLQAISRYRATSSGGPNFAYDLCVRKVTPDQKAALDLGSWQVAFNGAEPVRASTLEHFTTAFEPCGFRREAFYPCYGLAEGTLFVSGGLPASPPILYSVASSALEQGRVAPAAGSEDACTLVSSGRAWLDEQIVIVNAASQTRCAPDQVGEIWISGPHVAQGYWNRSQETEQVFRAYLADTGEGPFLRTGDLGFLKDGELFVTGRSKDLIIIRGRNYYPQDIETTVESSHPGLRVGCGAAFAVDVDGREQLVVVQEVKREQPQANTAEMLAAISREIFQQYELRPYAVVLIQPSTIPKTSSGKLQRHAVRASFLDGTLAVVDQWRQGRPDDREEQA